MLLLSSQGYLCRQPMVTCNHSIGTVSFAASRLCTFDEQDMLTQQLACQPRKNMSRQQENQQTLLSA